ncbi:MAG: Rid family detoxifying hydrolase [Patescibacteria group bacterium]
MYVLETGAKPIGPYSPLRTAEGFLYCSGHIGIDSAGALVPGGIREETRQALENLSQTLRESGGRMQEVVKTTVYLTDINDFTAMNEIYAEYFRAPYPARATVQVAALPKGACIEIEAVAMKKMIS